MQAWQHIILNLTEELYGAPFTINALQEIGFIERKRHENSN